MFLFPWGRGVAPTFLINTSVFFILNYFCIFWTNEPLRAEWVGTINLKSW